MRAGQRAKIGHALHFVIRQLDAEMIFQPRKQIQRLQAVDSQLSKKSSSGASSLAGT